MTANFVNSKCGISSVQGYNSNLTLPGNYLTFYYDSVNSKLDLWLVNWNGYDIGASQSNTYYTQRLVSLKVLELEL